MVAVETVPQVDAEGDEAQATHVRGVFSEAIGQAHATPLLFGTPVFWVTYNGDPYMPAWP